MTVSTPISTLLQTAADPVAEQLGVTDAELVERNRVLNEEVTRLRLRVLELESMADMDPLLPLYNRRAFMREVERAQSVLDRYDLMSSIIFFDLDGFKAINDRYGHGIGDKLLERVADTLLSGVRQCDMVARLGGDEFGVLLFKSDAAIAEAKAGVLSCRIGEQSIVHPDGLISIGASWGVAPCEIAQTPEQILDRADRAMYLCKRTQSIDTTTVVEPR
ncbi:GGDEF domain-containing protein [Algimonas porphyrae]|uniref:GGDEF domain-containing protein n=1 Tax=Algimonas porphyrae TaxID=1128113 RepID=UPI0024E0707A|nr:GGDEF domain-containing protein [Algimonas porphyrae]